jgi:putative acyl-CoA dehydrogenase
MAVVLQAALLVRHGPPEVADAFVAARLGGAMRGCYGALPKGLSLAPVIARARVKG